MMCSSGCVDVMIDASNCGACDHACASPMGGQAHCSAGQCVGDCGSDAGLVVCGGGFDGGGTCQAPAAEDCFNNIDDDCNGLVDCADPACAPVAECVDDAPGFTLGLGSSGVGSCPAEYSASAMSVGSNLNAPNACVGCSCNPTLSCSTTLTSLSSTPCPGGAAFVPYAISSAVCNNNNGAGFNFTTGSVRVGAMNAVKNCVGSGSPSVAPATFAATEKFCGASKLGGGCGANRRCLARPDAGQQHCAAAPGMVSCTGSYTPLGGTTWYTGLNDTRTCGTSCLCGPPLGGGCGTSVVRAYGTSTCSGTGTDLISNMDSCGQPSPINSASIVLQNTSPPSCTVSNTVAGSAMPTGAQTVCCQ
jgi:hypothetical protein